MEEFIKQHPILFVLLVIAADIGTIYNLYKYYSRRKK